MNILQSAEGTTFELLGGARMSVSDAESAIRKVVQAIESGLEPRDAVAEVDYERFTRLWEVLAKVGISLKVINEAADFLKNIFD